MAHSNYGSRLFENAALPQAHTHLRRALELNPVTGLPGAI